MTTPNDTVEMLRQAIALKESNHLPEAKKLLQQICRTDKNNAEAHYNLGDVLRLQKKPQKALSSIERAVKISPDYAAAWGMLGRINKSLGKLNEAESHFRRAASLRPGGAEIHKGLADVLTQLGKKQEAVSIYNDLARVLFEQGRPQESITIYKMALAIESDNAILYSNLGSIYESVGELDEAETCLVKALQLDPNPGSSAVYNNMGNVLKTQGKVTEAEAVFRKGLEVNPDDQRLGSNLLLCLQSIANYSRAEILEEHIQWAKKHATPPQNSNAHNNSPDPDRRIRIGYVSPDLRTHAVGYLVEPILANHNSEQFEIFCYAEVSAPDSFTERLRSMVDGWRNTCGMSDSQVATMIRSDGIDILVDLAGHTSKSRLTVFTTKPAPIQVAYLGYSDTTGMSSIDYRLTDEISDPVGDEKYYTEELIYLREGFSCYTPPKGVPEITRLPALSSKTVTFACLNNLYKINSSVIDLWCRVLHATPSSRLIIFRHVLKGKARDRLYEEFAERGIDRQRVELLCDLPTEYHQSFPHGTWHMGLFEKIDIMLDTFPRDSHVIACEALWMGVPVVTMYGERHSGRICASVLTTLELPQLIASTADEYLEIATELANNLDELEQIRNGLRDRMKNSSLCDSKKFTGILEDAYRDMWKRWCVHDESLINA